MANEEYEVIPTSPIRRLEKRISKIEETSSASDVRRLIEQIIELIKSNQRLVDDVIKANSELINEISVLPGKIDSLVSSMSEFLQILRASATEEGIASKESAEPLVGKISELVEQNRKTAEIQQAMLSSLDMIDKRLKRLYYPSEGTR